MTKDQKTYLYAGIGSLLFIVILAIIFYRKGKRAAEGPKVTYPQGGNDIPPSWSPEPLVNELYDVMSGLATLSGSKEEAWRKLRDLPTDDMVVSVYDVFNQKYFGKGNGTLTQWIADEWYYDPFSGVKDSVLARLRNLKLA